MDKYMQKNLLIKLNKKLWDEFQEKIEKEYGTTYKHTSEEIEKAIENYVDSEKNYGEEQYFKKND